MPACGRASRGKREFRGEMGLANKGRAIAVWRQRPGKTRGADRKGEVDPIIPDAVGERQQPGQDGGSRGLTDQIGCDTRGKTRALSRQQIEMRRLDMPVLKAKAIGTLLIRGNQEDMGTLRYLFCKFFASALPLARRGDRPVAPTLTGSIFMKQTSQSSCAPWQNGEGLLALMVPIAEDVSSTLRDIASSCSFTTAAATGEPQKVSPIVEPSWNSLAYVSNSFSWASAGRRKLAIDRVSPRFESPA